jgi:hypothetical protein
MSRRRYVIAAQVQKAIGLGQAAAVLAGQAGPAAYQCLMCDRPGDATRDETTVIVMAEERADILAYAHATCAPSQVTTFAEVTAARQAALVSDTPPATPDVMLAWFGPYAALVADEPATPAMLTADGAVNLSLGTWLLKGFTVAAPGTAPPPAPGWAVHLRGRSLQGITAPGGGWWWQADTAGQAVELPSEWVAAARQHGAVAVLAGDLRLAGDSTQQQFTAALDTAIAAGRVAYGLTAIANSGGDEGGLTDGHQ